jgi:hypothetical protein
LIDATSGSHVNLSMHHPREVVLELVELGPPRSKVIVLEHHEEQDFIGGSIRLFAVHVADGKLGDPWRRQSS